MAEPLVSVIIPAYNAEKYLDETIKSILAQTYSNWELIVVDDGSTDGTASLAKKYAAQDKRIAYLYQTNQRMASARNTGIKHASGKYIAFLDADNLFLRNKLAVQVAHLETNPGAGVSYAKILHFRDGAPNVLYENKNESPLAEDQFRDLLYRNSINVLSVLIRRECFDKYGAFKENWRACDEQYVWINLAANGAKFAYLPEIVGLLRLHANEYSRRPEFLYDTAVHFLQLLDIVGPSLSPEKKERYKSDFTALRKAWQKKLFIGKLLKHPAASWFLMPFYIRHFEKNFTRSDDMNLIDSVLARR
jgi:teichuronic acid biosynthesis glycosyltransferase TuaG